MRRRGAGRGPGEVGGEPVAAPSPAGLSRLGAGLAHVRRRRRALGARVDAFAELALWEETCVPSYLHPLWPAALVAWARLFAAVDLAGRHASAGPVLDFGASVGELGHLLPASARPYSFVEREERAVRELLHALPEARRLEAGALPPRAFAAVFALDALEHDPEHEAVLGRLAMALREDGVLVLCGPTENALYRLGRRVAGFESHHLTDVHALERAAARHLERVDLAVVPLRVPLFRVSVWRLPDVRG